MSCPTMMLFVVSNHMRYRTYGALLMFFTGILYLLFEHIIEKRHRESKQLTGAIGGFGSRVIMGMQVRNFPVINQGRG